MSGVVNVNVNVNVKKNVNVKNVKNRKRVKNVKKRKRCKRKAHTEVYATPGHSSEPVNVTFIISNF